jgi:hypothetical protein
MYLVFIVVLFLVGCGGREIEVYEGVLDGKEAVLERVGEIYVKETGDKFIGDFRPKAVVIRWGKFFVADRYYPKIWVIGMDGVIKGYIGGKLGKGPGELVEIGNFDVSEDGFVYVFDQGTRRVSCFDTSGKFYFSFQFPSDVVPSIGAIKIYGDKILCGAVESKYTNPYKKHKSRVVAVFDLRGNFIDMFGVYDEIYKRFHYGGATPEIAFDSLGRIYIAQWATYRIYRYSRDFKLERVFGFRGLFREAQEDISMDVAMNIPKLMKELMKSSQTGTLRIWRNYLFYEFTELTEKTIETRNYIYNLSYLKIYDLDGNYIKSDIKFSGKFLDVYDGNIYIYENNEPGKRRIGVYRLKIRGN